MNKLERKNRIIARGEHSGHSHIIIGDAIITHKPELSKIFVEVSGDAWIKHLMENSYVTEGKEVWTKEHSDIKLKPGKYEYVGQVEFHPYEDEIRRVRD